MTHIDLGATGAKRATWRDANPRELLHRLIAEHPKADEDKWRRLFWREVQGDEALIRSIVEYWLDNNLRSMLAGDRRAAARKQTAADVAVETATVKAKVRERVRKEAKILLLGLLMPNGKPLRHCTGDDCRKFGGWLAGVARAVPAKKQVGDVLSEGDVRKLWLAATK